MKTDQIVVLIFSVLGILCGFVSTYLKNVILAGVIPLTIYAAANVIFMKLSKSSKLKPVLANSLATFIPVWLVAWIFLFNLR